MQIHQSKARMIQRNSSTDTFGTLHHGPCLLVVLVSKGSDQMVNSVSSPFSRSVVSATDVVLTNRSALPEAGGGL
jgi:hypothetical protein